MKINPLQKKLILAGCCLLFVGLAMLAHADCPKPCDPTIPLQTTWPTSPIGNVKLNYCSKLGDLVKYIYGWGVGLGGIGVFIALVIAGFEYITSIGNPSKMKDAVSRIESAAIGLALLLGSWAIFNLINPSINTIKGSFNQIAVTNSYKPCTTVTDCSSNTSDLKDWVCCEPGDQNCVNSGGDTQQNQAYCDPKTDTTCQNKITNQGFKSYCAATDSECLSNGGKIAEGGACQTDNQCRSFSCNNIYPDTTKIQCACAKPQMYCIRVFNKPALGCDVVRFYNKPHFGGSSSTELGDKPSDPWQEDEAKTNNTGGLIIVEFTSSAGSIGAINQHSALWGLIGNDYTYWNDSHITDVKGNSVPSDFTAQSYQAFTYLKDKSGNLIDRQGNPVLKDGAPTGAKAVLVGCGQSACGCTIGLCLQQQGGSAAQCVQSQVNPETGQYDAVAYNEKVDSSQIILAASVKDVTKNDLMQTGSNWVNMITKIWSGSY